LGDNCLSREGYLSLIRAVASKGFRGKLKSICVRDQTPGWSSHYELLEIYRVGIELGVKMNCDEVTAREETAYELSTAQSRGGGGGKMNSDEEEILHMRRVFQDIVSDDRIETDEILMTSYKKSVYL
jgi:hypothetical protein